MPRIISTPDAAAPGAAYSQGMRWNGLIITAGQVGVHPETGLLAHDLRTQVRQSLANMEAVLRAGGGSLGSLIKVTCFLQSIDDFAVFDEEYRRLVPEPLPGRSTVGVDLAWDILVEIEAIAIQSS